ncbi:hypothetical protein [Dactylosporangium sp. NPDC051541]|uniref:hypothetical protein n=1 Tax=Dactylosporangium sp. NPDC051541 TaxID=3363977 RepID=UPI003798C89D
MALPDDLVTRMAGLSGQISGVALDNRTALAKELWRRTSTRDAVCTPLRRFLAQMAPGRQHCMYCGDNHGTDIDHFEPVTRNPLRTFDWLNHLLACSTCNSHQKRDQFPVDTDGRPLLIDPTLEDPFDHLFLSLSVGEYKALTAKGRLTIEVCGLNRFLLSRGRVQARRVVAMSLRDWKQAFDTGDADQMQVALQTVHEQPFADVCQAMLRQAITPGAEVLFEKAMDLLHLLRFEPLRELLLRD